MASYLQFSFQFISTAMHTFTELFTRDLLRKHLSVPASNNLTLHTISLPL